nr:ATP-binding protein [Calditrichia bacterium]
DLFVSRFGADLLYLATPGGVFREVAESRVYSKAGYLSGFNTGAAAADVDGDRDPDLVVGNRDFWSSLLENTRRDSAFIHIQPVGVQDTREALGTKIWIWEAGSGRSESGLIAFRELVLSNGYFSQNEGGFLLGIGEAAAVDVQVRFLNGDAFFFSNLARGASLRVDQAGQFTQIFYSTARFIRQFLHTPHIFFEIIKLLLFVLLLLLSVRFIEKRYRWRPTHTVIYVLGVIALYAILAFSLPRDQGLLYHLLPFAMILFALAVLVTVNEPIKKSNERQAEIRRSLQQAGVSLSNAQIADRAVAIFGEALLEIYPFDFVAVYLYQPHGNIFLRKFAGGEKLPSLRSRFHLERREVTTLAGEENPSVDVPGMLLPRLIREGDTTGGAGEILLRPVAKEGELKAVLAAGIPAGADRNNTTALAPPDAETRSMVDFLVPQLANTLTHIRIFRDASERDKLAAIGSFSSGILHNLKNPVDGLRMMIEALYHDMPPGDPRFEYVRELYQGVLHLKNALLHSFEFATRTGGDQAPVDIHTVLGEISGHFANLSYLPVQLEFTGRNFKLMGNAQQLKVALENLISNALEASGVDKTVTVSTEFLAAEELLRIDVRDSGAGIPAEQIDKIFDIFYSTRGQSRGLGLAITREIIRRHGGHIDVKSAPGKGTCMSISLPAVSPIPEVADEPHPDH